MENEREIIPSTIINPKNDYIMKLTSEQAMMLGNILISTAQRHYEGMISIEYMIDVEINKKCQDIENTIKDAPLEELKGVEAWAMTALKQCEELRRLKLKFEDIN